MSVSMDKSTVLRVVRTYVPVCNACKANQDAPLLELSSYPFSNYMKLLVDVDLATSLLHKSRREIPKNEALQTDKIRK